MIQNNMLKATIAGIILLSYQHAKVLASVINPLDIAQVATDSECLEWQLTPLPWADKNLLGACSLRGECVSLNDTVEEARNASVCECDDGWTGNSDWINGHGWDCQINTLAISILWGINILEILIFVYKAYPVLKVRKDNFIATRKAFAVRGKKYRLNDNRGLIALTMYYGVCAFSHMFYAIHRIAAPDQRIGYNIVPTVLFFTAKVGLYGTNWLFSPALLQAVLRGQNRFERTVRVNDILALIIAIASVVLGGLPLLNYFVYFSENWKADPELFALTWQVYQIGMTSLMFIYGLQAIMVKRKVIHALDKSYSMAKKQSTLRMRDRLAESQNEIWHQAFVQLGLYFAFWAFPFLWNKHDYFLPVSWLAMPILGFRVANTADSRKHGGLAGGETSRTGTHGNTISNHGSYSEGNSMSKTPSRLVKRNPSLLDVSYTDLTSTEDDFVVQSPAVSPPAPPLPAGSPPQAPGV